MDGNHGAIHPKTSDFVCEGIPFIMASDMKNNRVDLESCSCISEEQARSLRKGFAKTGDVLLSHKATIGRTAIVGEINTPFVMLTPQVTYYRILRPEILDRRYLSYYFRSREFRHIFEQWAGAGSTRAYIGITDQTRLPIRFPDIATQTSIAGLIGVLDDKIDLNRRMSATLEEMARALYRSWFVDFDPVHARAVGQPPAHMDPTTAALFPDSFGPDGLPKGWESCPLSELCIQVKKVVKPMDAPASAFLHFSLPAFDAGRLPIHELGEAIKSNKAHVPHDAILFSRLNPSTPRVWWAKTAGIDGIPAASTEFFVAAAHDPVETPWLYCLLSSSDFLDEALSRVTGTSNSHQRVPPKALAEIEVIAPSPETVEAFGDLTGPWFEKIHTMAQESQTLATLRDSLLPRLISGELRIREAEKQVEEVA